VKDGLFGDKEVKKTEVIEEGDRVKVRETETDIGADGEVEEIEVEERGDAIE
jgi:hypothetical protein